MSFLTVSMATPYPSSRPSLNKHNFPCDIFSPKHRHPLLPPCSQDTDYRTSLRSIPITSYKSLSPIRLGVPWRQTCILIYIYVSAHVLSRNLSNACSVPRIVLDAGFQHSSTEWRNFFSCSPCKCVCNVYVHVYVYENYSVSSLEINIFFSTLSIKITNYWCLKTH